MSIIKELKLKAYPTLSKYFSHTTLAEGVLKNTDEYFRCFFVDNIYLRGYMLPRMFDETQVSLKNEVTAIQFLKQTLNKYWDSIDMCIAVVPLKYSSIFEKLANFKTQVLIRSFIDTSNGWEGVRKRLYKKKREFCNKMDRNPSFSCRISKDLKDFNFFYNDMHMPHIQNRFRGLAMVAPYERMKNLFLTGFVLFVQEKDTFVAGGLCSIRNDTLFMQIAGVLNGDEQYLQRGASYAQYYFTLKYALEHGISKVDLVRSRPFFNDGVFKAKKEWGARVYPNDESRLWVYFFIPSYSHKIAHFFAMNPLIIFKDDKMYALVGRNSENVLSAEDEKRLSERYCSTGLQGLMLIQSHAQNLVHIKTQSI